MLPGHNFRMPNHLAALGVEQLKKLQNFNKKRKQIAEVYDNFFNNFPQIFEVQKIPKNFTHSYQMYTLRVKSNLRNSFLNFLNKDGFNITKEKQFTNKDKVYENVKFEIWASKIEKGGVEVDVVEVRNPKPFDPNRKESNEANINKPLRFGSRTSITTAGNWE